MGACRDGKSEGTPLLQGECTLNGLSADKWTYFSFETGDVVGQSTFADEQEDASWAARTDWDLAICGEHLKTNGHGGANTPPFFYARRESDGSRPKSNRKAGVAGG